MAPAPKKKSTKKKAVSAKNKPNKLGHDPLSWIDDDEAKKIKKQNQDELKADEKLVVEETKVAVMASVENEPYETDVDVTELAQEAIEEFKNTEEHIMLDLPVYFGIAQVAEVYQQMQSLVNSELEAIEIKGEDVESIDTAALQLLVAFVKQAMDAGKTINWLSGSEKLKNAANVLNINEILGLPS